MLAFVFAAVSVPVPFKVSQSGLLPGLLHVFRNECLFDTNQFKTLSGLAHSPPEAIKCHPVFLRCRLDWTRPDVKKDKKTVYNNIFMIHHFRLGDGCLVSISRCLNV